MSDVVISVEGVGKKYRLGTPSGTDRLSEMMVGLGRAAVAAPGRWLRRLRQAPTPDVAPVEPEGRGEFWALRDVSFEVKRGEAVGIIGRNGAGKSTLLKVLGRITAPTIGRFGVRGRVASLLEVGTGFHGELTGRENIFLSGTLLGMSRREIQTRLDEIVAFAEIDRFLDTPVKRYSSGMQMRLGFAVAAHLRADILIVDEVLAVGDVEFQKKCLGKMGDVAGEGRTILFVSHNANAVRALCNRGVWLHDGAVRSSGPVSEVVEGYTAAVRSESQMTNNSRFKNAWVALEAARIVPEGQTSELTEIETGFWIELTYSCVQPDLRLNLSIALFNQDGVHVLSTTSVGEPEWDGRPFATGQYQSRCQIPGGWLNEGLYTVEVWFVLDRSVPILRAEGVLTFEVVEGSRVSDRGGWFGKWGGVVRPRLRWTTDAVRERAGRPQVASHDR